MILKNKDGELLPISEINDNEEFTLIFNSQDNQKITIHNIPIRKSY